MHNPYEVLGIKENATEAEIKAAYREQVKKYHPDKFQNNPLYDLAEDKLREVNEAYETLTKGNGASKVNNGNYSRGATNSGGQGGASSFYDIRSTIEAGNLDAAEIMLNKTKVRNAEWFFLRGIISMRKGWYDEAFSNLQTATAMEPGNYEYRNAMNQMSKSGAGYRTASNGRGFGSGNDDMCKMLQCFICTDLMCDCI
jgi:molecular chaperone DnaJ